MSSYLAFRELQDTGKTKVYGVASVRHGDRLGLIRWFGRWRQYTLEPAAGTIWNKDCLKEVADFLDQLMAERKKAKEPAVSN